MIRNRATKTPKIVSIGSTHITPITAEERSKLDRRIQKKYDGFRRRYPEIHGKVVDFITHSIEDGTLYLVKFNWCDRVDEAYFGDGFGGVITVFLLKIRPKINPTFSAGIGSS